MGIGLYVEAKIPGRGFLGRKPGRDQLFLDLQQAIRERISDPLMAKFLRFGSHEHTLCVYLHPCAEPVEFIWKPDQTVTVSAKTSTVGPGFHAFLIELLEHVGKSLDLNWNWCRENADEAGFEQLKDFTALQKEMAKFWKSLAGVLLEHSAGGAENLMLNMPLGYAAPQLSTFAITPMGPLSRDTCRAMENGTADDLIALCRRHSIWWDKDPNAEFWRNTGISLMWCDVPWHVPYAEDERSVCDLTLDCMHRASKLDRSVALPEAEIDELILLMSDSDDATPQPPREDGIGYRRQQMRHRLTGGWSLCFPGYYYHDTDDDGAQQIYWFDARTIRFTSFTISHESGNAPSTMNLLRPSDGDDESDTEIINLDKEHVQGRAEVRKSSENGEEFWMLQGKACCANNLAITTICYDDPADKNWAIETLQTIMHPAPSA
jgi:hypothetical protein